MSRSVRKRGKEWGKVAGVGRRNRSERRSG